jgi:spore germination protein
MLPTPLALSLAASREGVPFPAFVEAVLMEVTFELLREAGARLPRAIGQTIGIVGGLVIGDAAIRAGITSPFMVIIVAATAISSFMIPGYNLAIAFRLIRFPIMVMAAVLGMYGVILAFIIINIHLILLKSFGTDYMAPFPPIQIRDLKDTIVRGPSQWMGRRPEYINPVDIDRKDQDPIKEM